MLVASLSIEVEDAAQGCILFSNALSEGFRRAGGAPGRSGALKRRKPATHRPLGGSPAPGTGAADQGAGHAPIRVRPLVSTGAPVTRPLPWLLIVLLTLPIGRAFAADDPEALAELAVRDQPALEAVRARVAGLKAAASVARVWTDPMLGVELSNVPVLAPSIDQHPMAGIQLRAQQGFPAPGLPQARAEAADARVDAARSDEAVLANALRGEVRARFWDLALLRQLQAVTADHVAELDSLIDSVGVRYQVGAADQHDLLQLQLRRDRLAQTLPDLAASAEAVQAALNGALARDPGVAIDTPGSLAPAELPGTPESRRQALTAHPELAMLAARAEADRAEANRARAERVPGPTVWLGYRIRAPQANGDAGDNLVSAGVSVPVPAASGKRWNGMAAAAEQRARAAEQQADAVLVRLTAALAAAETRHTRAVANADTYRDALEAAADAALESTLSAYQVDRAGFADLIRAEIDLLDVRRQRLRAEADANSARADILTLLSGQEPTP